MPQISEHFRSRKPSAVRMAQIEFSKRTDKVDAINTSIGNVSLPMHPAMIERMFNLDSEKSPFKNGVVPYTSTIGDKETIDAFRNIIAASGFDSSKLYIQVTDGGSQAMELSILGTCGAGGSERRPLLLIDPSYSNYRAFAQRSGVEVISIKRSLNEDGKFELPNIDEINEVIKSKNPAAMVIVPYDNPTGQFYTEEEMNQLAQIAIDNDMWIISDEAYRELFYTENATCTSIWNVNLTGIEGRRISIESASKVWNGCGLRIGALVTDHQEFHQQSVAENTAGLCSNYIAQYIFGSLAHLTKEEFKKWFDQQRKHYKEMFQNLYSELQRELPGIIISKPDASIYTVVDLRNIVNESFVSDNFVKFCATQGKVELDGENYTLLMAPLAGFYIAKPNPGNKQMRIAYVETPERMRLLPVLLKELLGQYTEK